MRSRHPIYSQENLVVVDSSSISTENEFNIDSFQDSNTSGRIIETENETVLTQKAHESSLTMDEVILIKGDGIFPEANGFNPRMRHPFRRPRIRGRKSTDVFSPQNIQGFGNIPEGPKVRSFTEVGTGLNARRGNREDQCPAPEFKMEKDYTMFMEDMAQKGIEVEFDQQRFNDLSVNQETDAIDEKSIFEAKVGLQGEGQRKTPSGRNSIYVTALQSIANSRKNYPRSPAFTFNYRDPITGNLIRFTLILEAHITCGDEISKLPRVITKKDKKIKFGSDFFDMFRKQYDKVFG
jgi:hypothetical protein